MDFNTFRLAIAGQESGGNYSAVNSRSGALGKYQIMPGNIGPWSRQYLGYSVSPRAFLNNPALQEKLATAVLRDYFTKWGPRGAAAAWYSGDYRKQSSYTRFRSNEPSIGEYVDQVMARAGGQGAWRDTPTARNAVRLSQSTNKVTDTRAKQSTWTDLFGSQLSKDSPVPAGIESADKVGELTAAATETGDLTAAATGGLAIAAPGDPLAPTVPTPQPEPKAAAPQDPINWSLAASAGAGGKRGLFIDMAKKFLGTPYRWGGAAPGGFDCSGIIQYAMKQIGIKNFPRVSWDQAAAGRRVSLSKLKPGDLVGFGSGGHIAIWLGDNMILEAPRTGLDVRMRRLSSRENAWGVSLDSILGK